MQDPRTRISPVSPGLSTFSGSDGAPSLTRTTRTSWFKQGFPADPALVICSSSNKKVTAGPISVIP